ncbi:hypothetical protein AMAG_13719 [Allomyces macrogynus ATCC 38327]|uniref:Uncharacterized protein n=1 Tax=Allomyces macrogynus (strain ATCC 38327) TaxID=578462 RepID=A0A0L0T3R0_ALLM3|nr:hypothetical protein AMAG_13719 [Allomyces macrogynus ATCC 38327]|eukprot:KNE69351.1 hypothetical protein AMAG_13719 [Allomyces macrogynus ATCC 38327]
MSGPSSSSRAPPPVSARRGAAAPSLVAPTGAHPSPNTVMATIMSNPDFFDLFSRPASSASSHGPSLPRSPPLVDVHSASDPYAPMPSLPPHPTSSRHHPSAAASNLYAPGAYPPTWTGRARASPSPPPMPLPSSVHPASLVAPRGAPAPLPLAAAAAAPPPRPPPAAAAARASPAPYISSGMSETASMVAARETALPAESKHNHAIRLVYGPDGRSLVPANHHALPCLDPMILCGRVVDMSVHMEVFLQDLLPRKSADRADWQPVDITFDILSSRLRQTLEAMEAFRADLAKRASLDRESRVQQQVKRLQAARAARSAAKDAGLPSWSSKKGASSSKAASSSSLSSGKLAAPKSAFPHMPSDEDVAAAVSQYAQVPPSWMMLPGGL